MARLEEKATVIAVPDSELVLEGIFIRGRSGNDDPGAVIAPPHPLYGGSMTSHAVPDVSAWLTRPHRKTAGSAVISFGSSWMLARVSSVPACGL